MRVFLLCPSFALGVASACGALSGSHVDEERPTGARSTDAGALPARVPASTDPCPDLGLPTVCDTLDECPRIRSADTDCHELDEQCDLRECYLRCVANGFNCGENLILTDTGPATVDDCFEPCGELLYCNDHFVTPERYCDGVDDCIAAEDERDAQCLVPDSRFYCPGTQQGFISRDAVCDGTKDCPRGDDEPCPDTYACEPCQCGDASQRDSCAPDTACVPGETLSLTVSRDQLLDGFADCPLGDDEHLPPQFACRDQNRKQWCVALQNATTGYLCQGTDERIPRRDVCNGVVDCPAGDDEICAQGAHDCPEQHEVVAAVLASLGTTDARALLTLTDGEAECDLADNPEACPFLLCDAAGCGFPCANGQRIAPTAFMDGRANCPGGEDEPCGDSWSCGGESLPFDRRCDGKIDCADGSDEDYCPESLHPVICDNGTEIVFPDSYCGPGRCTDGSLASSCVRAD